MIDPLIPSTPVPDDSFDKPDGLDEHGERAYEIIETWRKARGLECTGGCKTYYSPAQWQQRGEAYGLHADLVIVHDGDCLSDYASDTPPLDSRDLHDALKRAGLYLERCTHWYHAVYPTIPRH